ncbi:MAG: CinA family protein [Selenomonadaceae bacterium]|nr:CinA family protein [Selenomonadaceae bacterium]
MKMEVEIGKLLLEKKFTISCAESCTGGLLTDRLTNIAGSSAYVKGSVIAYANEIKINVLHVNEETIKNFGAVSEQTAREMAENVRQILNTDIGVSITGIAGPGGGSAEKPVGLVYIGISGHNGGKVEQFKFNGTRTEVKEKAVEAALVLIQVYLTLEKTF